MNREKLTAQEILTQLFQLLDENATGTFFITTSNKQAIHATLQNGTLLGCTDGQQHGLVALAYILSSDYGYCKFIEYRMLPVRPEAQIDQTPETLESLSSLRNALESPLPLKPEPEIDTEIEELTQYINETVDILETAKIIEAVDLVDDWDYFPESITDINPPPDSQTKNTSGGVFNWFRKTAPKKPEDTSTIIEMDQKPVKNKQKKRI